MNFTTITSLMAYDDHYQAALERLWAENSEESVSNSKPEHVSALLVVFLTRAKTRVHVFCKDLQKDVYDNPRVIHALRNAIMRGVLIRVLVQHKIPFDSLF